MLQPGNSLLFVATKLVCRAAGRFSLPAVTVSLPSLSGFPASRPRENARKPL